MNRLRLWLARKIVPKSHHVKRMPGPRRPEIHRLGLDGLPVKWKPYEPVPVERAVERAFDMVIQEKGATTLENSRAELMDDIKYQDPSILRPPLPQEKGEMTP
jgi:hypothetical protein